MQISALVGEGRKMPTLIVFTDKGDMGLGSVGYRVLDGCGRGTSVRWWKA